MVRCHDWMQLYAAPITRFSNISFVRKLTDAARYNSNRIFRSTIDRRSSDIVVEAYQVTLVCH
jgi:hypothetical protein